MTTDERRFIIEADEDLTALIVLFVIVTLNIYATMGVI